MWGWKGRWWSGKRHAKFLPKNVIKIPHFNVTQHNTPRAGWTARGTVIAVRGSFSVTPFPLPAEFATLECCEISVHFPRFEVQIFALHNQSNEPLPRDYLKYISSLNKAILIGNLYSRHFLFGDIASNNNGHLLHQYFSELPLFRLHNENLTFFTAYGSSNIDHILCTENLIHLFTDRCYIGTSITGDHLSLLVQSEIAIKSPPVPLIRTVRDYAITNWTDFQKFIHDNLPSDPPLYNTNDVDKNIDRLTNVIQDAI